MVLRLVKRPYVLSPMLTCFSHCKLRQNDLLHIIRQNKAGVVLFLPFVLVGIISYFQQQRYFMSRSTGEARAGHPALGPRPGRAPPLKFAPTRLAPALAACDNASW